MDYRLIELCRVGDSSAIESFVQTYQQDVYRLALSILDDSNEADDATQESLLAALHALDFFHGSALTNLTNHPAHDSNPFWSPDGKRIAFERDQEGFRQIYVMDADGSNVMQLTKDEADHFLPMNIDGKSNPWSPDGSKWLWCINREMGEIRPSGRWN